MVLAAQGVPPAAVIFDFDGTIADTEWPIYESVSHAYRAHGLDVSLDEWVATIGMADNRPLSEHLAERLGREPDPGALAEARAIHDEARETVPVLPGVTDLIAAVQSAARGLAIASSSPSSWVEGHLSRLGLIEHFDAIRTRDNVDHGKPAPDLFLAAAAALELDPSEIVVIEDSRNGCTAAKAAGMTCVVVPNRITRLDIPADADLVLDSLLDFPYADFGLRGPHLDSLAP